MPPHPSLPSSQHPLPSNIKLYHPAYTSHVSQPFLFLKCAFIIWHLDWKKIVCAAVCETYNIFFHLFLHSISRCIGTKKLIYTNGFLIFSLRVCRRLLLCMLSFFVIFFLFPFATFCIPLYPLIYFHQAISFLHCFTVKL